MIEHFYQNIGEDWFTYPNLYKKAVDTYDNAKFVEVGSWRGRSACYMAVEIINSNKNIELYCVDTWMGSPEHAGMEILNNDGLYKDFISNIEPVAPVIRPIRLPSYNASYLFEDMSLDFVFIDAAHDYESVKNDIEYWYPKVKEGGILAGHDYGGWPDVTNAVNEWCSRNDFTITTDEMCWIYFK